MYQIFILSLISLECCAVFKGCKSRSSVSCRTWGGICRMWNCRHTFRRHTFCRIRCRRKWSGFAVQGTPNDNITNLTHLNRNFINTFFSKIWGNLLLISSRGFEGKKNVEVLLSSSSQIKAISYKNTGRGNGMHFLAGPDENHQVVIQWFTTGVPRNPWLPWKAQGVPPI